MRIRFAVDGRLDGPTNMSRDLDLLARAESGEAGCRVYGWDGPWVSLGRFQSPDRDLVASASTRWVSRPTGGKAVLHGHDVTVGLAVRLSQLGLQKGDLKRAYRAVVQPLAIALRACGVAAALAEDTRWNGKGKKTADCFAFSSPNDVVDEATGLKVCGCALRMTETAVLVQASLPNGRPLVNPESVIRSAALSYREWNSEPFAEALEQALNAMLAAIPATREGVPY